MTIGLYGPEYLQFADGGPAAQVRVFIFLRDTKTKAVLFANSAGSQTYPNPAYTDRLGEIVFYAEEGEYDLFYEVPEPDGTTFPITVGPDEEGGGPLRLLAFVHTQNAPANPISIHHDMTFDPAGIVCLDTFGVQVDQEKVAYPVQGVIEIYFGTGYDFTGKIYLS